MSDTQPTQSTEATSSGTSSNSMMPIILIILALIIGAGAYMYYSKQGTQQTTINVTNEAQPGTDSNDAMIEENTADSGDTPLEMDDDDAATVKEFTVEGSGFKFDPDTIIVKKGDTVRIVFNNAEGFHDWVLDEFNAKTAQLEEGQSETIEFVADQAGEFEYYCSVGNHRAQGMVGTLTVTE